MLFFKSKKEKERLAVKNAEEALEKEHRGYLWAKQELANGLSVANIEALIENGEAFYGINPFDTGARKALEEHA